MMESYTGTEKSNTIIRLRRLLAFWELFIGIGALIGLIMMFTDPTGESYGMAPILNTLQGLPLGSILFQDLILTGIVLFIVNGATNLFSYYLLRIRNPFAAKAGMLSAIILIIWIIVQFILFPINILSTAYFFFGILELVTAIRLKKYTSAS